jgi:hypothetical protein
MIRGMLSGTETFQQAFRKMVQTLFMDFVTAMERMVEQWLLMELTKTSTTATQTAVRDAIQASSDKADLAGLFERALKSIGTSVQETFAGASAFFAPTLGPAAPAAAAGVAGAVSATALAGLPAFDIGSWSVPRTMAAVVHQGEMILPSSLADAVRGGGGGDLHLNFYGPVVDGKQWLNANRDHIMSAVSRAVRDGHPAAQGL